MTIRHFLRARLDSGVLRTWTGEGEWTIDEPIDDAGQAPGATDAKYTSGAALLSVEGEVRFGLDGRALVGTPVVGRTVDVFVGGFFDDGRWTLIPSIRRGLLDAPRSSGGVYSVGIVPRTYRGDPVQWSHEDHQRANPGRVASPGEAAVAADTFFSQMRVLTKGIKGIHFPGVPHYRFDRQYDTLAIAKLDPPPPPPEDEDDENGEDDDITGYQGVDADLGFRRVGGIAVPLMAARHRGRQGT